MDVKSEFPGAKRSEVVLRAEAFGFLIRVYYSKMDHEYKASFCKEDGDAFAWRHMSRSVGGDRNPAQLLSKATMECYHEMMRK